MGPRAALFVEPPDNPSVSNGHLIQRRPIKSLQLLSVGSVSTTSPLNCQENYLISLHFNRKKEKETARQQEKDTVKCRKSSSHTSCIRSSILGFFDGVTDSRETCKHFIFVFECFWGSRIQVAAQIKKLSVPALPLFFLYRSVGRRLSQVSCVSL